MKGTLANIVDTGYSAGADLRIIFFKAVSSVS